MTHRSFVGFAVISVCSFIAVSRVCAQQSGAPRVYEPSEVRAIPLGIRSPALALPSRFQIDTVTDTVVISLVIDTTGRVDPNSIVIIRPGNPVLRAALIARERQTEYSPGSLGMRLVPVRVRLQLPPPAFAHAPRIPLSAIRARVRTLAGSGPFVVPPLTHRYRSREYCEGDYCGCQYGQWEALATVPVYAAELDTLRPAFAVHPGERFTARAGYYHVLRPAVVIVTDTVRAVDHVYVPGDTLYLREYTGELFYDVWYRAGSSTFTRFGSLDSSTSLEEASFRQVLSNGGCLSRRALSGLAGFSFEIRRVSEDSIATAFRAPTRPSGNVPNPEIPAP